MEKIRDWFAELNVESAYLFHLRAPIIRNIRGQFLPASSQKIQWDCRPQRGEYMAARAGLPFAWDPDGKRLDSKVMLLNVYGSI